MDHLNEGAELSKEEKLAELKKLGVTNSGEKFSNPTPPTTPPINNKKEHTIIDRYDLPYHGQFYPESWSFAVKKPTAEIVASFSVINEQNRSELLKSIEDLICECVVIYDNEADEIVDSSEINEPEKLFWMLLLRKMYILNSPITWEGLCESCAEMSKFWMDTDTIEYPEVTEKLLSVYDGRRFTFKFSDLDESIIICMPTIGRSSKVFRHVIRTLKAAEKEGKSKSVDKVFHDKIFLLYLPYLFETGQESVMELVGKYRKIRQNIKLQEKYNLIINSIDLDNLDTVNCECSLCKSMEVAKMKFPGGWRKFFVGGTSGEGYFR